MLILRLIMMLVILLLLINAGMYLFTRDRRYVVFAWQVVRFALLFVAVFVLLMLLERYVLSGWRFLI